MELQGTLHARDEKNPTLQGLSVGVLSKNPLGRPVLTIGAHRMTGKIVKLDRPLGVLRKRTDEAGNMRYDVVGMIREKTIFKSRPKPLVRRSR